MSAAGSVVTLPGLDDGVNVVFKGTNSIKITGYSYAYVLDCLGATTVDLTAGSDTTLDTGTVNNTGIYCHSVKGVDALEITGSGKLTVRGQDSIGYGYNQPPVKLTGGTLDFAGKVKGKVTLGGVIIPSGKTLDLVDAESVSGVTGAGAVNNGLLVLKTGTAADAISKLNLSGSGYVKVMGSDDFPPVADSFFTNVGETIHTRDTLAFTIQNGYKKDATLEGDGYTYEVCSDDSYKISLGNLIITSQYTDAILLPGDKNVTVELVPGTTTRLIATNGSGMCFGSAITNTITGGGTLIIKATTDYGAITATNNLTIAGGNITLTNNGSGSGIDTTSGMFGTDEVGRKVSITGGKLDINVTGDMGAIRAYGVIEISSGMTIVSPNDARVVQIPEDSDFPAFYTIVQEGIDGKDNIVKKVVIEHAPSSDGGYDYAPPDVTVYNDPSAPNATIRLSGSGLTAGDQLVTERNPKGSDYRALLKLAGSNDVFATYNIGLKSGSKGIGAANLTFDLNEKYAGQEFTLVHKKADGTYEYFYATANAAGDLTFGPLYELSPFMLVKGRLNVSALGVPDTAGSVAPALWLGAALIAAAALAAGLVISRKRHN